MTMDASTPVSALNVTATTTTGHSVKTTRATRVSKSSSPTRKKRSTKKNKSSKPIETPQFDPFGLSGG